MDTQASVCLSVVEGTLTRLPPQWPEPAERRLALHLLDTVLHDVHAASRLPVRRFLAERLRATADAIASTSVAEGAVIWKLYNHGFVVRTATVTLGFDVVRTPPYLRDADPSMPDVVDRLVDECDVLFISHVHGDHADPFLAQAFLDAGKPVVAPANVWAGESFHDSITHLERAAHLRQELAVRAGTVLLSVTVYPGHQQTGPNQAVENNVPVVTTPEGMAFCQTGDQSWGPDFEWIDSVGEHCRVDVLMPNCWTADMPRVIRGVRPRLVIPGHENEMGHGLDTRIPSWRSYAASAGVEVPVLVIAWGESYHYVPED
jgi:hypothetical protein